MNILLQCCALMMLFSIIIMFYREKRLDLTNKRLFVFALFSCLLALIFDIGSLVCIYYATYAGFSPLITRLACKAYVILLVVQGYCGFLYASSSIFNGKKYNKVSIFYFAVFLSGIIAIAVSPIYYYQEGRIAYSSGLATSFAYGMASFFILSILVFSSFGISTLGALGSRSHVAAQ